MRAFRLAAAAIAVIVVVMALVLAVGIPSGFLTSMVASKVEAATGYRLAVAGTTRISLWPMLKVTLNDVTLTDPKDRTGIRRLTIDSVQADMTLSGAWSGRPEIGDLALMHPVLYQPLLRERLPGPATSTASGTPSRADVAVSRIKIVDGEVAFAATPDRIDSRLTAVNATVTVSSDRKIDVAGAMRAAAHAIRFEIKAVAPAAGPDRPTFPFDFTIDAPDWLGSQLSGHAEARLTGSIMLITDITGSHDDGAFSGWASVDFASKPLVKLDMDFQHLAIPLPKSPDGAAKQPWSDAPINVSGLNYLDAQLRLSAAAVELGDAKLAPVAVDAKLAGGILKAGASDLGAYDGQASGEMILDASSGVLALAMHADLAGVRALPLLEGLADFDRLDGKLQAKLAVRSSGSSQRALMAGMQGTVFAVFRDGSIRGINVAQMIRSLTSSPLSGWQQSPEQSTDLSQLSASFRIDKGQAVTTDLDLVGPLVRVTGAGTIALDTKMMGFRVEPKLVMTTEGQGRRSEPVGFGIPVMIEGPWSQPRIFPDMAGMLDNPDAAYAKLREMGKGLFGNDGARPGNILGSLGLGGTNGGTAPSASPPDGAPGGSLAGTLGNLIQQGLSGHLAGGGAHSRSLPEASSPPPAQAAPARPSADPPAEQPESQPMNDVLKQLFNR